MNFRGYKLTDLRTLKLELADIIKDPNTIDKQPYFELGQAVKMEIFKRVNVAVKELKAPRVQKQAEAIKEGVYAMFLNMFNSITGHSIRILPEKAKRQFATLIKAGYNQKDFDKAIKNAYDNMKDTAYAHNLTPEFITREEKFSKYLNMLPKQEDKPFYVQA